VIIGTILLQFVFDEFIVAITYIYRNFCYYTIAQEFTNTEANKAAKLLFLS